MANFRLVTFPRVATFAGAHFEGSANFNAIRGERAFDLANARFEQVPDFIQANFKEAPRLDNVLVTGWRVEPPVRQPEENPDNPFTQRDWLLRFWQRSYPRRLWTAVTARIFYARPRHSCAGAR